MVRVAGLKRRADMGLQVTSADGLSPREVLARLAERTRELVDRHARCFRDDDHAGSWPPRASASSAGTTSTRTSRPSSREYFESQGLPGPDAARGRPVAPVPLHLRAVAQPRRARARPRRARCSASRGSRCPTTCRASSWSRRAASEVEFLPLEDLIAAHLSMLFPGMEVVEHHLFRVTRNADFEVEEDRDEDLLQALERELARRRFGPAVRLEVADDIDDAIVDLLVSEIEVAAGRRAARAGPARSQLAAAGLRRRPPGAEGTAVRPDHATRASPRARRPKSVFATLRDGDVLVHHPYESFATSMQRFIEQAAADPNVLAIKQTLYRTSGDSPIVDALIDAAEAGKQVVALVEIKARFDEQANIKWARALERAGCHVVYGFVGLKTHCKTALVVRQEGNTIRRYAHVGTGNYNPKTARMYEDLGLFTADRRHLRRPHRPVQRAHRLLAPDRVPLAARGAAGRAGGADRAHRARDRATPGPGRPAHIRFKTNHLVDEQTIDALYRASQAGVQVELLVRTFCTIRAGVPGLSENITRPLDPRPVPRALARLLLRRRRRPRVLDRLGRPHAPQPRPPGRGAVPGQRSAGAGAPAGVPRPRLRPRPPRRGTCSRTATWVRSGDERRTTRSMLMKRLADRGE